MTADRTRFEVAADRARHLVPGLTTARLQSGQRVAVCIEDPDEALSFVLAIIKAGAIPSPLQHSLSAEITARQLEALASDVVIASSWRFEPDQVPARVVRTEGVHALAHANTAPGASELPDLSGNCVILHETMRGDRTATIALAGIVQHCSVIEDLAGMNRGSRVLLHREAACVDSGWGATFFAAMSSTGVRIRRTADRVEAIAVADASHVIAPWPSWNHLCSGGPEALQPLGHLRAAVITGLIPPDAIELWRLALPQVSLINVAPVETASAATGTGVRFTVETALPMQRVELLNGPGWLTRVLTSIWTEVFDGPVDVNADFFELGGDSLAAVRILTRLKKCAGVAVPMRAFFQHTSITALSEFLSRRPVSRPAEPEPQHSSSDLP
jgi:acyl carrier protein